MSFILDALKKAERERARPRVPTLATIHVVPVERRRALWLWLIAGALCVNAALLFVLLRGGHLGALRSSPVTSPGSSAPTAVAPTSIAAPKPSVAEQTPAAAAAPRASVVPSPSAAPSPVPAPSLAATPNPAATPGSAMAPSSGTAPSPATARAPATASSIERTAAPAPAVQPAAERVATPPAVDRKDSRPAPASETERRKQSIPREEAPGSTARAAPAAPERPEPSSASSAGGARRDVSQMKLEVLVYSDNPAERAVYISGRRYVEGQRVEGWLRVEKIAQDGVTLSGEGQRVVLRQQ